MASEPFKRIALLDLETDGFHPRVNNILEVGLVIVEVATLQDIYAHRGLVRQPWIGATLWSPLADAQCREIHTKSGLWAHLNDAQLQLQSIEDIERDLLFALHTRQCTFMGGHSPSFDRAFIHEKMPTLDHYLSHRMLDVSTLRELWKSWCSEVPPPSQDATHFRHRALEDCMTCLEELKFYRKYLYDGSGRQAFFDGVGRDL